MKILMLGNGFDLQHKLPTTYLCFLKTVEFIKKEKDIPIALGYVFESLQKECKAIKDSMGVYEEFYNQHFFYSFEDEQELKKLKNIAQRNFWLKYFSSTYNNELGWIDFEKEIAFVITEFEKAISNKEENKYLYNREKGQVRSDSFNHTIQQFDFFFNSINHKKPFFVKEQYIIETPFGSAIYSINKEKIINDLLDSLNELKEALKIYLKIFVQKPLSKMCEKGLIKLTDSFFGFDDVITFNYTNTYEKLYGETPINYIHGSLSSNIILGINPDDKDDFSNDPKKIPDTSYIMFKKYYQRVYYRTDTDFVGLINNIKHDRGLMNPKHSVLVVCGHSLDVTDQDIIKEVFDISDNIYVVCHELEEIGKYVSNLIQIYGKKEFDRIRSEKQLQFVTYDEWHDEQLTRSFIEEFSEIR